MDFIDKFMSALARRLKWEYAHEYETPIKYIPKPPEVLPEAQKQPVEASLPVPKPSMPKKNMLDLFSGAIRDYEGKPGDINYRNNNPGNFRMSPVGYLPKYGKVIKSGGFAKFPTYELGWEYLQASVHHTADLHPYWTIYDYFALKHAPASDGNDPKAYAANVAARCGVPVSTTLGKLFA